MLTLDAKACREISQNILKIVSPSTSYPHHIIVLSVLKTHAPLVVVVVIFFNLVFLIYAVCSTVTVTSNRQFIYVWMRIRCFSLTICSLCIPLFICV